MFTQNVFENGLAPAPWGGPFFTPSLLAAAQASPYISTVVATPTDLTGFRYRSFELGNLDIEQEQEALRALLGLRGEIDLWRWETAALFIDSDIEKTTTGIADAAAIDAAIRDGSFNPFADAYAQGTIGPNSFDNALALTNNTTSTSNDYDERFWSWDLKANGPLIDIQYGEVLTALGLEYRHEEIDIGIDPKVDASASVTPPLGTFGESSYAAERDVIALFVENQIPLYDNGVQRLYLNLSGRYEDYQDSSDDASEDDNNYDAFVYKAAAHLSVNHALHLRASYGTAFRAPTLGESYGAPFWSAYIYDDDQTPDNARISTNISGNQDLEPEESDIFNIGFVFQPVPEQGLRASVEYYHIETEDKIVNSGQSLVNADGGASTGVIRQDSVNNTGPLALVYASWFNAAELTTDGIDYDVSYRLPTNTGYWEARVGVNQVLTYEIKAAKNSPTVSYLGRLVDPRQSTEAIAGPGSVPRYKGYAQLIWNYNALTLSGIINYVDDLDDNEAFTNDGESREVNSWSTLDLAGSYQWDSNASVWLRDTTLTLGIENVFDEEPPFAAAAFADGYDSSLYTIDGRRISLSLRREF